MFAYRAGPDDASAKGSQREDTNERVSRISDFNLLPNAKWYDDAKEAVAIRRDSCCPTAEAQSR